MKDEKYLVNGQKVLVIGKIDGNFIVQNIYYDDYDDQEHLDITDRIYSVGKIFDKAPILQHDIRIKQLQEKVSELLSKRQDIETDISNKIKEGAESLKKFEKFHQLKRLDDFIDGKLTHYAILSTYSPKVLEFGDTVDDSYRDRFQLLTLFGRSDGNLEWGLNKYYDGSGSWDTVIPCTSQKEAEREIRDFLQQAIEICKEKNHAVGDYLYNSAKAWNVKMPKELINIHKNNSIEGLKKNINNYKESIKTWEKLIDDLTD